MPGLDQLAVDVGRWFAATFAGATGDELELDQTDSPDALILGDPAALATTAAHLRALGHAFDRTAGGLRQIDVGRWTGAAADAFHAAFQNSPKGWIDAADAFGHAADVVEGFRATVVWAKGRAAQAIELHRQGQVTSEQARRAYNDQVSAAPTPPGPFVDPGLAALDRARQLLADTRSQRDAAGADAARALAAASASAPPPPSGWDRLVADGSDGIGAQVTEFEHLLGGVGEGIEGLVKFARTLNPGDPYNATHPAQYLDGLSTTAAGLVHSAMHPLTIVKDLVGTEWGSDPSRAAGRLIPDIVAAVTTGGGSTVAAAEERTAVATAERTALESGERTAAEHAGGKAALGTAETPGLAAADARAAQDLARAEPGVGGIEGRLDSLTVHDTGPAAVGPAAAAPPHITLPPALRHPDDTAAAEPTPRGGWPVTGRDGPRMSSTPPLRRSSPLPLRRELDLQFRGENDADNPRRRFFPDVVRYFNPTELEASRLAVRDGRLYWAADSAPFDTTSGSTLHSGPRPRAIFVMDGHGNMYASLTQTLGELHHSSFLGGRPVAGAGEIEAIDGVPTVITRKSGHYRPLEEHHQQVRDTLTEQGVDPSTIDFKPGF